MAWGSWVWTDEVQIHSAWYFTSLHNVMSAMFVQRDDSLGKQVWFSRTRSVSNCGVRELYNTTFQIVVPYLAFCVIHKAEAVCEAVQKSSSLPLAFSSGRAGGNKPQQSCSWDPTTFSFRPQSHSMPTPGAQPPEKNLLSLCPLC